MFNCFAVGEAGQLAAAAMPRACRAPLSHRELNLLEFTTAVFAIALAIGLDALLGEPRRWHPLIGFGRFASALEARLYRDRRWAGALAWGIAVLPLVALASFFDHWLLTALLLSVAVGRRSLTEHTAPIAAALHAGDLALARQRLGRIVSRDTADIPPAGISRATVESILENGCDAIFGALFWALVAGAPGVVLYRLSNTLDAMWGYKNVRYRQFGWAAARLDDVLNYVPARLTALAYALVGDTRTALRCWREQGRRWKSPNAGPVMATGAGALRLELGGAAVYHGSLQERPALGAGAPPDADAIDASLRLVDRALGLWLLTLFILAGWAWLTHPTL